MPSSAFHHVSPACTVIVCDFVRSSPVNVYVVSVVVFVPLTGLNAFVFASAYTGTPSTYTL